MRQAGHGRSAASSPLEEQGDSEAVGKEAAPSTCRPSSSCQQPREGVCEMVAPGDGKLVWLREMTLKEGRGLTSWCLVCGAGRGRPRGGERERARQGGGGTAGGAGPPLRCLPPLGWKQGHRSTGVLGCLHACWVGAETGCSASLSPPHHLRCTVRVQAGSSAGGGHLASLGNALCFSKSSWGVGRGLLTHGSSRQGWDSHFSCGVPK